MEHSESGVMVIGRRETGLLIVILFFVVSCSNIFAPKLGEISGDTDLVITDQSTPEDVLTNFRYAYVFHDSLVYSRIIDSSFVFTYYDPDAGGSGRYESWGRNPELKTTASLFRIFDNINLIWNSTVDSTYRLQVSADSSIDTTRAAANYAIISKSFELSLDQDISITGNAVFHMRKSSGDEKWRITHWIDESIF